MTQPRPSRLFLALTLVLLPAYAAAQDEPPDSVFPLRGLTVTALRTPVPLAAVPLHVSVIEGADLRSQGIRSMAEALDALPGVSVVESGSFGGTTSLFVRGGESDYVRVLLDGVPVNAPGGGLDLAHLTTENVERIEVVRGPSSVLYGSDAVTAVIEIHTREGTGRMRGDARVRAGNHGSSDLAASVAGKAGALGYTASVANFDSDGTLAFNNEYRNTEASARVDLSGSAGHLAVAFRYSDHDFHFPTDGSGRLSDRNQFTAGTRSVLSVEGARDLGPARAELTLGLHEGEEGIEDAFDDPEDEESLTTRDATRRLLADGRVHVALGAGTTVTVGGLLEEERLESSLRSESAFGPFKSASDNERGTAAVYAQLHAAPAERLSITAGLRHEDNDAFGGHATWRLGAAVGVAPSIRLRASAGTGFKEPTFLENFATGFARGNPDLMPEESRSWEAGFDAQRGALRFAGTWFDQTFRNLIDFTFAPAMEGDPNYQNIARAEVRGLELSAEVEASRSIRLGVDYTWLDAESRDPGFDASADAQFAPGRPLLRRPRHAWSALASWTSSTRDRVSVEGRWVGRREDQDFSNFPAARVVAEGYFLLDASVEVPLTRGDADRWVSGVLRVENLLDREYENPTGFAARGITVLAGVRAGLGR